MNMCFVPDGNRVTSAAVHTSGGAMCIQLEQAMSQYTKGLSVELAVYCQCMCCHHGGTAGCIRVQVSMLYRLRFIAQTTNFGCLSFTDSSHREDFLTCVQPRKSGTSAYDHTMHKPELIMP